MESSVGKTDAKQLDHSDDRPNIQTEKFMKNMVNQKSFMCH